MKDVGEMNIVSAKEKSVAQEAAGVLKSGGVIVFPTDTAYGLGVDALNEEAIAKLFALKGRAKTNPVHIVVADRDMAMRYAVITDMGDKLFDTFLPGPLTLIFEKRARVPSALVAGKGTVGIRIPDTPLALDIARAANTAYTATSANKSGDSAPYTVDEVVKSFGDRMEEIGLIIDAGDLPERPVSTLVDVRGEDPVILREGPVSRADIEAVIG